MKKPTQPHEGDWMKSAGKPRSKTKRPGTKFTKPAPRVVNISDLLRVRLQCAHNALDACSLDIALYVNRFSKDPGGAGAAAVDLLERAKQLNYKVAWRVYQSGSWAPADLHDHLYEVEQANRFVGWVQGRMSALRIMSVSQSMDVNRDAFKHAVQA